MTNKPYYKVNAKTYYKIKKNGQATKLSAVETMAASPTSRSVKEI